MYFANILLSNDIPKEEFLLFLQISICILDLWIIRNCKK